MNNKYYFELKNQLIELISLNNTKKALKIINEELSMPYIPLEFEKFLINMLNSLSIDIEKNTLNFSLAKVIDLLLKLDKSKNDLSDLIQYLSKFNLKNEKEELEYFFLESKNKRNRAMIFELLINEKADIECEYGKTIESKSIKNFNGYSEDVKYLEQFFIKDNLLKDSSLKLLDEIYLTQHVGQKLTPPYSNMVLYTILKIFNEKELLTKIKNLKDIKEKFEKFIPFDKL